MAPVSREILQRLYGMPPDRFVAARNAAAADARRGGDPATAREITQLRRPTVAAWLVNLLAIRRPDLVAELTRLAEALREAQRDLSGPTLRGLNAQRKTLVGALVTETRRLAAGVEGAPAAGRLPLAEVEATLNAALADAGVADQVRSGRLLRSTSYAGFGEVPRPQLRLVTGDGPRSTAGTGGPHGPRRRTGDRRSDQAGADADQMTERERRQEALARDLEAARVDQDRVEAELADALVAERDAVDTLAGIEAELAEIERRRAAAEQEVSRRALARRQAERAAAAARRRTRTFERELETLTADDGPPWTADDRAD